MDGHRDCHTEWSQQRSRDILWCPLYAESKKTWYKLTYSQNRNRLRDLENLLVVARKEGWGEGIVREFGMYRLHCYISNRWPTRTYCIAHGTLFSVMWQPGWEGSLRETGYIFMYGWVPSLFTWNYHNTVNWLYPNKNKKLKKKDVWRTFSFGVELFPRGVQITQWLLTL